MDPADVAAYAVAGVCVLLTALLALRRARAPPPPPPPRRPSKWTEKPRKPRPGSYLSRESLPAAGESLWDVARRGFLPARAPREAPRAPALEPLYALSLEIPAAGVEREGSS